MKVHDWLLVEQLYAPLGNNQEVKTGSHLPHQAYKAPIAKAHNPSIALIVKT